ncbi:hypothetical protein Y032_0172g344 [Ancylostoma ceylanicum]|uniref:Uncharacterized protein n=1 Tax=Ancylostoma ceylanicum TaxID=53326 RepID=A0A016SVE2_9BILA|nr:hypothetical protein Y032_0172g344 [Ancylostoma ceylanicum]
MGCRHKAEVEGRHGEVWTTRNGRESLQTPVVIYAGSSFGTAQEIPVVAALLATIRRRGAGRSRLRTATTETFRAKTTHIT